MSDELWGNATKQQPFVRRRVKRMSVWCFTAHASLFVHVTVSVGGPDVARIRRSAKAAVLLFT